MLGKSPIKWRQRPDMTIAVDWDVKHQFNQTNKQNIFSATSFPVTFFLDFFCCGCVGCVCGQIL